MPKHIRLPRRSSVRLVLVAALLCAGSDAVRLTLRAQENPVAAENRLPGAVDWDINGSGDSSIQGFAADISVNRGETVSFKIDTDARDYTIDVYRLGFYGGSGARKLTGSTPISVHDQASQPDCLIEQATGLYDCGNWSVSAVWTTANAVSGIYVAKVTRIDTGGSSHIVFIVRDDARKAEVLMQASDTTWQAYNQYGMQFGGGGSFYCGGPVSNAGTAYSCPARAVKVSYNRPIDTRDHDPQSFLFNAEYPMVRFLEANGYDVKYWAALDTDRRGAELVGANRPRAFLSVGHDEYWSGDQRQRVEEARNAGVNLAFFSGNELFWKTRYEPSIDGTGTAHRTLVSYKETLSGAKIDPAVDGAGQPIWTGTWRDPRFSPPADGGRPENALIGQIWTVNSGTSAITVPAAMAGLRLWQNTRVAALTAGAAATLSPESLGYEWDEDLDNGFRPPGVFQLSATTVAGVEKIIDYGAVVGIGTATHHLTLYRHDSGALVFGAGTVQWSWGLDGVHDRGVDPASHVPDQAMQQATVTLLADMGAQPGSLQTGADPGRPLTATSASNDTLPPTSAITSPMAGGQFESGGRVTISGTAADNGGGVVAGVEVSLDGGTTWGPASGTTAWSFARSPGGLGTAAIRARAVDDSGNRETAGPGITVSDNIGSCPCASIWNASSEPNIPSAIDPDALELGVKFQSDIAGFITGIRFFKGPGNGGTHLGNLWTAGGARLGSAVFTDETAFGWQQVNFSAPVAIAAGTTYVASYHTADGSYAADGTYFAASGVNSPPLHALPSNPSGGNGLYRYGPTSFPTSSFNATNYWVDVVFASSQVDATPPSIAAVRSTIIDSARVTIAWSTDEAATSRIDYSSDPAFLTAENPPAGTLTISGGSFITQHVAALAGLESGTVYYYRITATDRAGHSATLAGTITVPAPTLRDTIAADFSAGRRTGTYLAQTTDGEVILVPAAGSEFSGPMLSTGWIGVPWGSNGSIVFDGGALVVDGVRVATCVTDADGVCLPGETTTATESAIFTAPHRLEFVARFTGDQFQHAGFAVTFDTAVAAPPWAIFSTDTGGRLYARSNTGSQSGITDLGTAPLGAFHRYRIDWNSASLDYYLDGAIVASHALNVAGPMRPVAGSDFTPLAGDVSVDWMRMSPYASAGTFESRIFDAGAPVEWRSAQWIATEPPGTSLAIAVRTGSTPTPDGSWSGFIPVAVPGPLGGVVSQFIQYQAVMTAGDPDLTPSLEDIIISAGSAPVAVADTASVPDNGSHTFPASGPGSLAANDTDADGSGALTVVAVTAPAHGTAVVNADGSVTYTLAANYSGPDAFVYTVSDGLLIASATVAINGIVLVDVPDVVGQIQAAAASAITAAGLTVGSVTTASSETVPAGSVSRETPAAGTSVAAASAVNLVVSSGPAPVSVPNVVGQIQAAATSAITTAGLTVGSVTTASSATVASGLVISESPGAGTMVARASRVDLTISSASPPTITAIGPQVTDRGAPTGAIAFTVGAVDTTPASLTLTGDSSNPTLVPNANIVFGGSGTARTVTVTPQAGQAGATTITVTVGDGTAAASTSFQLTVRNRAAGLLDLNGDGGGDVFLYNRATGERSFELISGLAAAFAEIRNAWDAGWQIYPARLNADSSTDFFLYDPARGYWIQALNHAGDGTFTYTLGHWDSSWTVTPADLDGDGLTDLFVYNVATGVWVKCVADGGGGFQGYASGTWDPGWTIDAGDLNGDGRADLVLYNTVSGSWVEALSQAGFGGFEYPAFGQWGAGWQVVPADLNGDGLVDLFRMNAVGQHVSSLSRAGGGFDEVLGSPWESGWSVTPGDLNGDAAADLFLYSAASGVWVEAFSDGAGSFTYAAGRWDPGWAVAMTDFNDDGLGDLVLSRADGTWIRATNTGIGSFEYAAGNWGIGWTVYASAPGRRDP
ncbi:MAG: N,N-dimethylformamidase beta subunit family domain-containing protein [Acidobacteriota bacterium]